MAVITGSETWENANLRSKIKTFAIACTGIIAGSEALILHIRWVGENLTIGTGSAEDPSRATVFSETFGRGKKP